MKKSLLIVFCTMLISTAFSQRHGGNGEIKWLSLAVKGGFGGTMFLNKDVSADLNVKPTFFSPTYSFGGRVGMTYGDHVGISVEPLWSTFGQEYTISNNTNGASTYVKTQKFTSFDLLVALRYLSDYGFYAEAGPQFSTLKTASVKNDLVNPLFNDEIQGDNYKNNFAEKFTGIAAGVGFAAINGDRLQLLVGLRGTYTLTDFSPNYNAVSDGVYRPAYTYTAKTNPLTIKLMLELNYIFGFWGDANCGRGRLMLFQ